MNKAEIHPVRGHTCAGLVEFQEAAHYVCVPTINELGKIEGCDDTNQVPINYCPFCGEKLA